MVESESERRFFRHHFADLSRIFEEHPKRIFGLSVCPPNLCRRAIDLTFCGADDNGVHLKANAAL